MKFEMFRNDGTVVCREEHADFDAMPNLVAQYGIEGVSVSYRSDNTVPGHSIVAFALRTGAIVRYWDARCTDVLDLIDAHPEWGQRAQYDNGHMFCVAFMASHAWGALEHLRQARNDAYWDALESLGA